MMCRVLRLARLRDLAQCEAKWDFFPCCGQREDDLWYLHRQTCLWFWHSCRLLTTPWFGAENIQRVVEKLPGAALTRRQYNGQQLT